MSNKKNLDDQSIQDLFDQAEGDGTLSTTSRQALDIADLGAQIQAGLGVAVDDVDASEVVLVTVMPDDSGSIRFAGNAEAVRQGHNQIIDALSASKQAGDVLMHTRYLNGFVLNPYTAVTQAVRMDEHNYDPNLGTPLYDQSVVLLGTVLAKAQEFLQSGVPVRTVTLIITDGGDCGSTRHKAKHVKSLVDDMLAAENHIVAAIGIDDGSTDFRQVFRDMGIPDRWVLTPTSSDHDLRQAFNVFSQSAVRASQGTRFSQTALGGFAN
ncbi:hypothetical protein [Haliangium sp.]|uniref:hypothetical protein n=1 Tax=Haliangium sp. TaxID=2663208 RepID=UPI003D11B0D8